MQTVIQSSDFAITEALNQFINQNVSKSMNACTDQVERLVIRLKDVNGPKGGQDKECSVEINVANHPPIVVSKRSSDAYSSIRKALGRASRTTLRKLSKRRSTRADLRSFNAVADHLALAATDDTDTANHKSDRPSETLDWSH